VQFVAPMTQKILQYDHCFACGSTNKKGLKLKFFQENDQAVAEFDCPSDYEGYSGLIHGGIIALLMDEAMAHAIINQGVIAVTAQMHTHYRNPMKTGCKVKVSAWIKVAKTRTIQTAAHIEDADGTIIASGEAIYIVVEKVPQAE